MNSNRFRIECHCHTAESSPCGRVPAKELVRLYRQAGYDGIVICDHFTASVNGTPETTDWNSAVERFLAGYREALAEGKKQGIKVYLGAEFRFPQNMNDYLIFGLDEKMLKAMPWAYQISLEEFYGLAEEKRLLIIQAHPYRDPCRPADPRHLHGAEVFNGHKGHDSHNIKALEFAQCNGLIPTAGSDCHYLHAVGTAAIRTAVLPETVKGLAKILYDGDYELEIIS